MGLLKKLASGIRSLKWVASKNGREYLKEQKVDKKGIKHVCEHHNGNCDKHDEEKEGEK